MPRLTPVLPLARTALGLAQPANGRSGRWNDISASVNGSGRTNIAFCATAVVAGLALNAGLGWWWADRVAALIVAAVAAGEAWHTAPHHRGSS